MENTKTNLERTVYGGYYVAKILQHNNVKHVFTLTGGHIAPILVGCKNIGISVIDVRHEATTVFAADATSRLTDTVGVAIVTAGPGITNTITAVKNAQMAESPIVIIGGATSSLFKGRGSLQDIDQKTVMRPHVKWMTTIKSYRDLEKLNTAFYRAQEGVPGPVFVEIPIDILWPLSFVNEQFESGIKKLPQSLYGKLIKFFINRHRAKLFKGASYFSFSLLPEMRITHKLVPETLIEKVVLELSLSKQPILLCGSQVVANISLLDEIQEAITKLDIPVFFSGMTRGLLGKDHRLQFRHKRKEALKEADLIILAGVPIDFRLDYGRVFNHQANLINVNMNKRVLTKNKRPKFKANAHPGRFLIDISRAIAEKEFSMPDRHDWFTTLQKREEKRKQEIFSYSKQKTDRINPLLLSYELEKVISDDAIIIGDGGDFIATLSYIVQPRKPLSWLDPGPFGTLGAGAGFALASKCLFPERDVWLLYGDGSVGYSIAEWDTFIRHELPIIGLVGNDSKWMQVAREQNEVFKDSVATELGDRNYEKVVEGFGAKGLLLKKTSIIESILKQAGVVTNAGLPVLINTFIDQTDFRKGSISM